MKTKEEIILVVLKFADKQTEWQPSLRMDLAIEAMESYAKEMAVEFAVWTSFHGWYKMLSTGNDYWFHGEFISDNSKSSSELFDIFLTEINP